MTVPCPFPTNCEGTENPVSNLSSEGPDVAKCLRYSFTPISTSVCEFDLSLCSAFAAVGSDVGILCDPPDAPPGGTNPPAPVIYSSAARSCTIDCGDATSETYTVVSGTFVALSQAAADALAYAFACELAALQCTGLPVIFTSTAQGCTATCSDGTSVSYTTPAGFFSALSQAEANAQAFLFACAVAALLCGDAPPVGLFPGAGTEPEPPIQPLYGNSAQSCTSVCPDGVSTFTYIVAAGTYTAESRDAANAIANSAACILANSFRFCLSDLPTFACVNEFFFEQLAADGSVATTFAVVAGALPSGLVLTSQGFIQGVPNTPGSFTFTIRATNATSGNSSARAYTMNAIEITPVILPDGAIGTPYAQALSVAGETGSVTWSIQSGLLPAGLTLGPATGVISGTPTTAEVANFTVAVTDSAGAVCTVNYNLEIAGLLPQVWYAMETTGATIADVSGNAVDMALAVGVAATAAAGKVALAANKALNSCRYNTGDSTFLAWPGSGDVNIFGWVKITSPGTSVLTTQRIGITLDSVGFTGIGELTLRGNNTWRFDNNNGLVLSGALAMGAYVFYRIHYDATAQKWGVAFNNAAPVYEAGTDVITPSATGQFDLLLNGSFLDAGNVQQADEVCVFFGAMSSTDIDGIYNAGAGRTFP